MKVQTFEITCADKATVSISLHLDENPLNSAFERLNESFGITPSQALQEILGDFKSSSVVFDIEPDTLVCMVLAFESGLLHAGTLLGIARPQRSSLQ